MVTVRHRGVSFSVDLHRDAHEDLYARISAMFQIPMTRLKLVHKGRLLPPPGSGLEEVLRPGMVLQLIGSRNEQQLREGDLGCLGRAMAALQEKLTSAFDFAVWLASASARAVLSAPRITALFMKSLIVQAERETDRP